MEKTITRPSSYNINYARLYSQNSDNYIDIKTAINYVEIYESIYSPFITININITDSMSLFHLFPFLGEEYIELDIRSADGETGIFDQIFYIYKLSDRVNTSDKAYVYTLHMISVHSVIDMNLKLSQSMEGQPSTIVENILKNNLSIQKEIYTHPTKNSVSYISNYWSPLRNIKYLCDRAVSSTDNSPTYVFYETKKAFLFAPIGEMVKQDSVATYTYSVNTHSEPVEIQSGIIYNLYVDKTFDYITRIMNGAFGNRVLIVDTHTKNYNYEFYDFLSSYNDFGRLNPLPFASPSATSRLNSVFRTRTIDSNNTTSEENTSEWYKQRLTELSALNATTISIDVPGTFNIFAGNVIDVLIPHSDMTTITNKDIDISCIMDRNLTGRYLITSMKHMLTRERHTLSITCSKESMIDITSDTIFT